jgi:hypothetical protein
MGKLGDWWERCEQRRGPGAAPTSQKDSETAGVLSPLNPINPGNLSWSGGKSMQPDATALPYGPHNDPAARHDAEGAGTLTTRAARATTKELRGMRNN